MNSVIEQKELNQLELTMKLEQEQYKKQLHTKEKVRKLNAKLQQELQQIKLRIIDLEYKTKLNLQEYDDNENQESSKNQEISKLKSEVLLLQSEKQASQKAVQIQVRHLNDQLNELRKDKQKIQTSNQQLQDKRVALRKDINKVKILINKPSLSKDEEDEQKQKHPQNYIVFSASNQF